MAINFKKIWNGVTVVPKTSTASSLLGELETLSSDSKLYFHNGTSNSPIVTESHSATLTNKTLTSPVINTGVSGTAIDTDVTLAADSDTLLASQKATKAYTDSVAGAVQTDVDDLITLSGVAANATDLGTFTGTIIPDNSDNKEALQSLETSLESHIDDTVDAHDASAISNVPSGNLAATDVQGALNELQSDVDTRATSSALTTHTGASTGVHGVTGAVVGTTDTQTLSAKTLTSPVLNSPSVITPSRLDVKQDTLANLITYALTAANGQLVFATDSKEMYQVVDGVLKPVGGGSGSGVNYVSNSSFEANDLGYAAYADPASPIPTDGTGGSPNSTFVRSTSSPLRGSASGLFTKNSGASRQGEGFSYNFTIDPADQAQVLRISFDYSTSASYVDDNMRVYVYDVTNSQLIEVIDRTISASAQGKYVGTFQTNSNSTSYRLILHVADSSTVTSWTFKVDNVVVGPQTLIKGAVVTDWIPYTPTLTSTGGGSVTLSAGGNFTATNGQYRRVGDEIEYQVSFRNGTGGAATGAAGTVIVGLPSGLTVNTSKLATAVGSIRGDGFVTTAVDNFVGSATYLATQNGLALLVNGIASFVQVSNIAVNVGYTITGRLPIQGWSSNLTLSEDGGQREVFARMHTSAQTITSLATIIFTTKSNDTVSMCNLSTGECVIPESGVYDANFALRISTTLSTSQQFSGQIQLDGNTVAIGRVFGNGGNNSYAIAGSSSFYATKGQVVRVQAINTGTSGSLTGASENFFNIAKRSSPQTVIGTYITGAPTQNNYILNGTFEQNTTSGWATYADAAGAVPVDGLGGSPNVGFAVSATSPLHGTFSGLFSKDAANRQGQGLAYDFTINPGDQSSILRISMDYSVTSAYTDTVSGNLLNSDMQIFVYDRTNNQLIYCDNQNIAANAQGHLVTTFQSNSNSTSYRLIFHVASTNANAYDLKVDNVVVGPQTLIKGAVVTDWKSYTPTGSWTTNTTYTGKWRQVGDVMEGEVYILTSGVPTSTSLFVNLPTGYSIDTSKLPNSTLRHLGGAYFNDDGVRVLYPGVTTYRDTTSVWVNSLRVYSPPKADHEGVDTFTPFSWGAGDFLTLNFKVPIQGWSSNLTLSEDGGQRDVVYLAGLTAAQNILTSVNDFIVWNTEVIDTTNSGSDSTWTCPESGYYDFNIHLTVLNLASEVHAVKLYVTRGGVGTAEFLDRVTIPIANNRFTQALSGTVQLSKGDLVSVNVDSSADASYAIDGAISGGFTSWFSIAKRSSPQTLAGSETVAASYSSNAGQAVVDDAIFICEDILYDTHNAYNTSTGIYTCPSSGIYGVTTSALTQAVSMSVDQIFNLLIQNVTQGITRSGARYLSQVARTQAATVIASAEMRCNKGDQIRVVFNESLGAVNLNTSANNNFFTISRIGN